MSYASHIAHKNQSQTQPLFGKDQVQNNEGGYVFKIDPLTYLKRFLILGCEGGTFYQSEKSLTIYNAKNIIELIKTDGTKCVDVVAKTSVEGLAPKNKAAIFALALASKYGDDFTRAYALAHLQVVCRTATDLFYFIETRKAIAGIGHGTRRALAKWYTDKSVEKLAYQVVKYRQRNGWASRDILRLCHAKPTETHQDVLSWVVGKNKSPANPLIQAYEWLNNPDNLAGSDSSSRVCGVINSHNLTREMIPTEYLNNPDVQWALLQRQPLTALVRNLGNYGKSGLLKPFSQAEEFICGQLIDKEAIKRSRLHPFKILLALKTYASGESFRGSGTWLVCPKIVTALEQAFYLAFKNIEPTGKRFLIGLDVSGSMTNPIEDTVLSSREAAAAMCMSLVETEPNVYVHGFSNEFVPLNLHKGQSLRDVITTTSGLPFSATDCSIPMLHALKYKIAVDVFVIFTDNETYYGKIHPVQALEMYRKESGINAKLVVCAFTATRFSIADPLDVGMLDCVGLSADLPAVIKEFAQF